MAKKYEDIRDFAKHNPAVVPRLRKYFQILDELVTWPTTTTTTSTSTTTTSTTSTSSTTTTT